ncbi:hypothetical protein I6E68_04405 [Salinibacterium sp. NSLL150]|uniref:hypothetical protein n=1 Tax=unclassified Salinibacterium TaxID=2632331 RepID=UPI0018CDB197|nr:MULTISPECIES: hypothetical protein [unclassified Salinibacterium]MBH0098382.1 hypothetical protein [Salinibacterium sp. NSLL35]MBH0101137.1 hypothetical protein [Salinibacterium sp. NSLL150]MBH0103896.1 hypothetical protein [Salinibacterium sp. NSLL16]MBH0106657.1 hypothetical protein [Salinibacterium sp. NSLL17]MBH0109572.1 hypothetical protein [Salinibacterium sp. NG22]
MTWQKWSVVPVWALSLIGAVIIGVFEAPELRVTWLAIVLAACVILTFVIQLIIHRKEGFVARATASMVGALVIVAAATAIFALI